MNLTLLPKIGTCANCHEKNVPLEEIEIDGKKKEFCDTCVYGRELGKDEKIAS